MDVGLRTSVSGSRTSDLGFLGRRRGSQPRVYTFPDQIGRRSMKHSLSFLLAVFLAANLIGCGNVFFVGGAINPGSSSVSGLVSVVQVSAVMVTVGRRCKSRLSHFCRTARRPRLVSAAMSVTGFPCSNPSRQISLQDKPAPAS
jgi:hypothetical protein